MKFSKSLLLGIVVLSTFGSLSASAVITSDELIKVIRTTRSCPATLILENEPIAEKDWFSSFRLATGNTLRPLGDAICNSIGEGLCHVGHWMKGTDVAQTTVHFNLNALYFSD